MSLLQSRALTQCASAKTALEELCGVFPQFSLENGAFSEVRPEQIPEPYRRLLVHDQHMTAVLGAYHDSPLDLYVLRVHQDNEYYSRKIFLTPRYSAVATELGVARVSLRSLQETTRLAILQGQRPLGIVLMRHEWSRRIEPRWYLRLHTGSSILRWYGYDTQGPFYGRIGTIYCGGEAAIELLEIVTLWENSQS